MGLLCVLENAAGFHALEMFKDLQELESVQKAS